MKKLPKIMVLFVAVFTSCIAQNPYQLSEKKITFTYPETVLPDDTTKLWIAEGDSTKQIVTIFLQGGPKDVLNFEKSGKSHWRYLKNYQEYYSIHLHQANTLNPEIFTSDGDFTMEMARKEVDNTSEILYRAIKYFKDKGKTVYVLGHSYGAFIIPHYLATRPSLADRYFILSGRLDDPKIEIDAHSKGFSGSFKDGIEFITDEGTKDFSEYNVWAMKYYRGKQLLKAAIAEYPYTVALKNVDLSTVTYIYHPFDERVGGLTLDEIAFLKAKGVQVFPTHWNHGYTIYALTDIEKAGKIKL